MVHLHGWGRAAFSIEAGENAYVRWGRAAGELVGLYLENVRRAVVPKHPTLLDHRAAYGIDAGDEGGGHDAASPTSAKRAVLLALGPLFDRTVFAAEPR